MYIYDGKPRLTTGDNQGSKFIRFTNTGPLILSQTHTREEPIHQTP